MPLVFCPNCSNVLTISRADSTTQYPMGVNRFECRTCPYEDIIGDKSYYEKTEMKQKEVEDVFGGANEFANADSVATQCPAENCNGDRAYFFQLQIRSADEPMTTFLKVGLSLTYHRLPFAWTRA
ncbi:DNA-directed RNA polymerase III subunit RPC10 [Penicillium daleae]|uniref:DNA-directed RNA polymerase subunit n=1 Tax=Penicillium daleae TaxID=63821 RepID=A0AAD6C1J5_9EURO|nr:DNA-directed RNA polymerase III subunit RPC10 [Penicillium daleae]KAJ5443973.1 DNA-directed RNA polymerase III subunit RPC10 [Penicillium daleae]